MRPFRYERASTEVEATRAGSAAGAEYLAGGTSLVDLMRLDVTRPAQLVDVGKLPLAGIEPNVDGVRIGALVRNSDLAHHPVIATRYPVLAEALLSGASPQLRNMATVGGNLLQRTRCSYFRDLAWACNKREEGAGCSAIGGYTRMHAVLGTSEHCIAAHPSDMCVALLALDAVVGTRQPDGTQRSIPLGDFHTLPGAHPSIENVLTRGELITHVDVPASAWAARSHYVKVRDRASYAFALASAAVALDIVDGRIRSARIALGGVGTKPWRSLAAETVLTGATATPDTYRRAGDAAMDDAVPAGDRGFKVELGRRTVTRALREAAEGA